MKATAKAPANIAFIKYWGKSDDELRIPLNDSISMNLTGAYTITTVEFSKNLPKDEVVLLDGEFTDSEVTRVITGLDRIRQKTGSALRARVVTRNTFPRGAGSAASASGFAALTLAGFTALGVKLSEKELTIFARLSSGSASRSIPDGFVVWEKGTTNETSVAYSLHPPNYWDIRDILVVVDKRMKKVSTTEGMQGVATSPRLAARLAAIPERMRRIREAFNEKRFTQLGEVIEEDCLDMHSVMQTQDPPLIYWNETTRSLMDSVVSWRNGGLPVYFTIDAGPNVHLICEGKDEKKVLEKLKVLGGVQDIIMNKPSRGTRIISEHL